jgi:hypothetical protein
MDIIFPRRIDLSGHPHGFWVGIGERDCMGRLGRGRFAPKQYAFQLGFYIYSPWSPCHDIRDWKLGFG